MVEVLVDHSSAPGQPPIDVATLEPRIVSSNGSGLEKALRGLETALLSDEHYIASLQRGYNGDAPSTLAAQAQAVHSNAKFKPQQGWTFEITVPEEAFLITTGDIIRWRTRTTEDVYRAVGGCSLVGKQVYASLAHAGLNVPMRASESLARFKLANFQIGPSTVTLGLPRSALDSVALVRTPNAATVIKSTRQLADFYMTDVVI